MEVILTGKTKKGREKIKRWGNRWIVTRECHGRFLLFAAKDKGVTNLLPNSSRWVDKQGDRDFEVNPL